MTPPQARRDEMRIENDAQLRLLYQIRCWVRQEIRFREKLRDEWFRASPSDRATEASPEAPAGLRHTVGVADAGGDE